MNVEIWVIETDERNPKEYPCWTVFLLKETVGKCE